MKTRTTALVALALVTGLLTGCGRPLATAPAAAAKAPAAARAATMPSAALPAHLVLDDVVRTRTDRTERITVKGHADGRAETFVFSSFFPYYIPMYGTVVRNGRTLKLDKNLAVPLDALLHDADTAALTDEAKANLHAALYGLDFAARTVH